MGTEEVVRMAVRCVWVWVGVASDVCVWGGGARGGCICVRGVGG